jgi:hypothetical protein
MHTYNRWVAFGLTGLLLFSSLFVLAPPAEAGSKGRKNFMIGAAAVTAYGLVKKKKGLAVAGAVATGVGYHNYRAAKKRENRRRDRRSRRWSRRR